MNNLKERKRKKLRNLKLQNNGEVEKPQRNESQDSEIKTIKTKKEPVEQLSNEEVKAKLNNEIREIEGTYTP